MRGLTVPTGGGRVKRRSTRQLFFDRATVGLGGLDHFIAHDRLTLYDLCESYALTCFRDAKDCRRTQVAVAADQVNASREGAGIGIEVDRDRLEAE